MLEAAGLVFTVAPAGIDEGEIKRRERARNCAPAAIAAVLARIKAEAVSARRPNDVVIGADQVLECAGELMDKPADRAAARLQLISLRARAHGLHTAVSLAIGGVSVWCHCEPARLLMRPFSDAFLAWYLAAVGENVLETVGAYQVEGLGIQLFERIEGDHFTIMGLPLVPLLHELRRRGVLET